ncbi:hydroxyphenylacetyl-CoA thioesterase PaaI [Streptomyces yokosukanensis]|uniref:hydroxyphenylacetyl-CoA thioesterase PaaI n=1 Tax=Streptomyces yokosukanensis TaxID=67386 RepID=UPI000B01AEA0|nr:hydroxyphenylacetyl-CoA thioesterase PaaI [Streptomyces yokosukanensis]
MEETPESRADAMYRADRTCQELGIRIDSVAEGRATAHLRLPPAMVNGHGTAHGGYLFLLADVAFAYACNTRGATTVAQAAQVVFLRPASAGDELVAEAVERSRFGTNGIYDVAVRRTDGTVIAEFRGQSRSLPR